MDEGRYSDWNEFDVHEYAWRCYGRKIMECDQTIIAGVIQAIERLGLQPESLLRVADVGTGPNLFPAMLLAPFVAPKAQGGQIDLIEVSSSCRSYLNGILTLHDTSPLGSIWDKFEDFMAERSAIWRRSMSSLMSVATVSHSDLFTLPHEVYDAISSYCVTESITDERTTCKQAVDAILAAAKPGALVIMGHMFNSTGWHAGKSKYPAVPLDATDLESLYEGKLESYTTIYGYSDGEAREGDHGVLLIIGRKSMASPMQRASKDVEKSFTYYDTQACLYDEKRVAYLQHAILATVKPGDVVVDGGSGTGLLGLLAACAGAAKVYSIELNEESARIAAEHAKRNGMQDKITIIQADATTVTLPEPVDVIIAEVISCGFFYEPQLQIVQNLKRFLKPGGAIIPEVITNYVELIDAQDELYGLRMDYDARYYPLRDTSLTTKAVYLKSNFYEEASFLIDKTATVRGTKRGRANAVKISYAIQFSEATLATEPTDFLLIPQIIFLPKPIWIQLNTYYRVSLQYAASASPLTSTIKVEKQE